MSAKCYSAKDFKLVQRVTDKVCPHGHVCLALMKSGNDEEKLVVVKSLRQSLAAKAEEAFSNADIKYATIYRNEADNLRKLGDSCLWLSQFYGYSRHKEENGRLAALLVWEFLPALGPVMEVLHAAQRFQRISFAVKCDWMRRLLIPMQFLHAQKVLNGNLKTRNVFVDRNFCIKLTDYSISSWFDLQNIAHHLANLKPEMKWSRDAPSSLESYSSGLSRKVFKESLPYLSLSRLEGALNPEDDVYSFGVVCWEIAMGEYVDVKRILEEVGNGRHLGMASGTSNGLFDRDFLPDDTPVEVSELFDSCGVGSLGEKKQCRGFDDLRERYEQRFAILSTRLRLETELSALKDLHLETDHMKRIERCIRAQERRREATNSGRQQTDVGKPSSSGLSESPEAATNIPRNLSSRSLPSDMASAEDPPQTGREATLTSAPSDPSLNSTGFQRVAVYPNRGWEDQLQPKQDLPQDYGRIDFGDGSCNVRIIAKNIRSPTFIQNSNVVINPPSPPDPKLVHPAPPPSGVLTESENVIDRNDKKILRNDYVDLTKWERLAKHLGLTDGEASNLKIRHEVEGLVELNCRLLEFWEEKESTGATKKKLAFALWMSDEKKLAKKIK